MELQNTIDTLNRVKEWNDVEAKNHTTLFINGCAIFQATEEQFKTTFCVNGDVCAVQVADSIYVRSDITLDKDRLLALVTHEYIHYLQYLKYGIEKYAELLISKKEIEIEATYIQHLILGHTKEEAINVTIKLLSTISHYNNLIVSKNDALNIIESSEFVRDYKIHLETVRDALKL